MGAEKQTVAIFAAKFDGFRRAPAVTAHDGGREAEFMGLLHDEGHLVVVLGRKQDLGAGIDDVGQLGAEIGILGGEAFKGHHRTGTVEFLPGFLEDFGQSLGVVAGNVV